ncbi:32022_t:CDS:2, partial [Gigaspora margarita]
RKQLQLKEKNEPSYSEPNFSHAEGYSEEPNSSEYCDGKTAYDLTNDFVTKSLYKGGHSFLNEEFFGISSLLELKGMTVLIRRDNDEIRRINII